jgi:hypothetical protein
LGGDEVVEQLVRGGGAVGESGKFAGGLLVEGVAEVLEGTGAERGPGGGEGVVVKNIEENAGVTPEVGADEPAISAGAGVAVDEGIDELMAGAAAEELVGEPEPVAFARAHQVRHEVAEAEGGVGF